MDRYELAERTVRALITAGVAIVEQHESVASRVLRVVVAEFEGGDPPDNVKPFLSAALESIIRAP